MPRSSTPTVTAPTSASVPLALDYANTLSASRGRTSDHLDSWLAEHDTAPDRRFAPLRDAIRTLIRAAGDEQPYPEAELATVNAACAAAPQWLELTGSGDVVTHVAAEGPSRLLAEVARSAIELLSDDDHANLRACHAPGCVQFFVRTHHRQEFCGAACGNRARAARHYQRRKGQ
jgi:predicted RNA-binding Zn ribbon-like protein